MTTNTEDFTALDIVEIARLERDFSRAFLIALILTFVIEVLTFGQGLGILLLLLLVKFLILLWPGVKFSKLLWYIPKNRMIFLIAYWLSAPFNLTIILVVVSIALMIINDKIFRKRNFSVGFFGGYPEFSNNPLRKSGIKKRYFLILAVLLEIGIFMFVVRLSMNIGESMVPTLADRDVILLNLWNKDIKQGDMIRFKAPDLDRRGENVIKKVVAVAGDKVKVSKGVLYVNGKIYNESAIIEFWKNQGCFDELSQNANTKEITVQTDYYYVIGDNRTKYGSADSRYYGTIPKSSIFGKIIQLPSSKPTNINYCQQPY